jgi:hypothetical protein
MHSGFDVMMTIADAIYLLCAATSLVAAWLLLRHYAARRTPLLLWSIAFAGLAISNVLLLLDFGVFPDFNLALPRTITGAAAMVMLVYGLIRDTAS